MYRYTCHAIRIAIQFAKITIFLFGSEDTSRHSDSIPVIVFLACDWWTWDKLYCPLKRSHFPKHDQRPGAVHCPDSIHSSQRIYGLITRQTVFNFLQLGVRSLPNTSRARQFNPLNPSGVGWVKKKLMWEYLFPHACQIWARSAAKDF